MTTTWTTPTDEELRQKRINFLRTCKPKEYRELRRDGELEEAVALKVEACKSYAQRLMQTTFPGDAWNRAIRLELLESETD